MFSGINTFGFAVLGNISGTFLGEALNIKQGNLGNLSYALGIKLVLTIIPLLFIWVIPNKEDIETDPILVKLNQSEDLQETLLEEGSVKASNK